MKPTDCNIDLETTEGIKESEISTWKDCIERVIICPYETGFGIQLFWREGKKSAIKSTYLITKRDLSNPRTFKHLETVYEFLKKYLPGVPTEIKIPE